MAELLQSVDQYLSAGKRSEATRATYVHCFGKFETWCRARGLTALPALESTLLLYLADLANRCKTSTVRVHAFAIAHVHTGSGHPTPLTDRVYQLLAGVARVHGDRPEQKRALSVAELRAIVERLGADPQGKRNRAILLVGFASALRRSDVSALDLADTQFVPLPESVTDVSYREGLVLRVGVRKREKQYQAGRSRDLAVFPGSFEPTCPVRALRSWLTVRGLEPGPLFCAIPIRRPRIDRLSGRAIADVVQRSVALIGLDPLQYGGHSLRSGMVTAASSAGASDASIMRRTDHHSHSMLLRYTRDLFGSNPLKGVL